MDYFECKHGPEYWKKKNKKLRTSLQYKQRIPCLFPALPPRKLVTVMKMEPVIVTMRFLGVKEEEDLSAPMSRIRRKHLQKMYNARSKVVVFQQPCGLYSHVVFSKVIRPRDHIMFRSMRHEGHPFSLTIFVDGCDVTRVSQCCEYRRQCGEHVGGPHGHFIMVDVEGGYPCSRCMAARDYRLQKQERIFRQLDQQLHDTVQAARNKIKAIEENFSETTSSSKSQTSHAASSSLGGERSPKAVVSVVVSSTKRKSSTMAAAGGSLSAGGEDSGEDGGGGGGDSSSGSSSASGSGVNSTTGSASSSAGGSESASSSSGSDSGSDSSSASDEE